MAPTKISSTMAEATARDYAATHSKEAVSIQTEIYRRKLQAARAALNGEQDATVIANTKSRIEDLQSLIRAFEKVGRRK